MITCRSGMIWRIAFECLSSLGRFLLRFAATPAGFSNEARSYDSYWPLPASAFLTIPSQCIGLGQN
jgi:hypothetical protein